MSIRTLSVDFIFYGLLDLLQRSVGVIMVPVYTRVLSQKEYGDLDIIFIFSSVLCILVDLQFIAGFSRLFYDYRAAGKDKRFAGTAIVSRLIGAAIIVAAFLILGFLGKIEFSFLPSFKENTVAWIIAVVGIPQSLTYEILLLHTRMLRWKKLFVIGVLSNCLLSCTLSAFFAIVLKLGIVSVVLGLAIGQFVGLVVLGWGLRKEVELCLDTEPFKELIRYTLPLVPGWWLAFATAYLNRFFIFAQLGPSQNAILAVCMKVAGVVGLFSVSFVTAWQPLAMSHIHDKSGGEFYVRSMRLFVAGGIFSIYCLFAFLEPILTIFAPSSYGDARNYFPLFAVGTLLSACATNLQLGNQIAKKTHWISISAFVSFFINIAMLIVLTNAYGIFAAGISWVISFAVKDVILYVTSQRNHRIPYDKNSFVLLGVGCGLLLLLGFGNYSRYLTGWFFTSCVATLGVIIPWISIGAFERQVMKKYFRQRLVSCNFG